MTVTSALGSNRLERQAARKPAALAPTTTIRIALLFNRSSFYYIGIRMTIIPDAVAKLRMALARSLVR